MLKLEGESYLHAAARDTLVSWLRLLADDSMHYTAFEPIRWVPGRAKERGVYPEYPFDEQRLPWPYRYAPFDGAIPTYEQLKAIRRPPIVIADIALVSDELGYVAGAIEIVHKNPPSSRKREFYKRCNISAYCIDALWIVKQVGSREQIPETVLCRI